MTDRGPAGLVLGAPAGPAASITSRKTSSRPTNSSRSAFARPTTTRRLAGEKVYVSFDIDFVDATHAPGVGGPELAGPSSSESLAAVRALEGRI